MNRFAGVAGTVVLGLLLPLSAAAETRLFCGDLLDVEAGRMVGASTVVVRDGEIVSVERGRVEGDGEAVDLSGMFCLPGLMDMHTHLTSESSPTRYVDRFTENEADVAFGALAYARRTLLAGFTTVRDVGDSFNVSLALRDAINRGEVVGPRMYTSGKSLATTGGHADPTNGWRADLMGSPGPSDGVLNGVAQAREAVRQRYKDGSDLIKITITGGVLSVAKSGLAPQFLPDEVEAVVQTARDYDMHVAAHAHGKEGMKRAILAGIHSIEHGTMMDDEIFALMAEHGVWFVPTIMAGEFVAEKAEIEGFYPDLIRPKAREIGPRMQDTFSRAWRAGVPIAFGTDSGVSLHGDNAREFVLMVETGMSPAEAIRTATINASKLLGVRDRAGTLEAGNWADVVAVPINPLEDISALGDVGFVMKAGVIHSKP